MLIALDPAYWNEIVEYFASVGVKQIDIVSNIIKEHVDKMNEF